MKLSTLAMTGSIEALTEKGQALFIPKSLDFLTVGTTSERIALMMKELSISEQTEFGRLAGASKSVVGQWLSGEIKSVGPRYAYALEERTGFSARWIMLGEGGKKINYLNAAQDILPYNVNSYPVPLLNTRASMGSGIEDQYDEIAVDLLHITKEWASRALSHISGIQNLAFIHGIGDSMSPTFNDGDILLIDTGNRSITADKIFVLEAHNRLFIKRVRQRMDGVFEISSDNPAVKTIDILSGEFEVNIKGRVVWVWNGKRL